MLKKTYQACLLAGFFLILTGCQATPQTDRLTKQPPADIPAAYYIQHVPFTAQQQYYCGPTTLSEVFGYHGYPVAPEAIAPRIFIPEREGSLQLEMVSATRQFGFLPYTEQGTLNKLLQLVSADIPVIVLQNLSVEWLPQWHYAVVIGYDLSTETLTLHTGVTPDYTMALTVFERTWARGNHWMLAPLPHNKVSEHLNAFTYVSAAYDMLTTGQASKALPFLEAATSYWPDDWLAYFLLGNHYLSTHPEQAIDWFAKGFHAGQHHPAYLNNFAHVLAQEGCKEQALELLRMGRDAFPDEKMLVVTEQQVTQIDSNMRCPGGEGIDMR
ncbi:PA2778 family cysteine peptidase [Alteromonas sp. ASW11-19]|uniref:PA2778 family cysteine peptidase n=1 Tax=Alteromonas salexigens TaxID=2982530 RepID=A0ABT2VPJ1_9ALTE|nr:PA2778 family cysteine peptidase [Alteromonas salexigens]MCU7555228.1 PA2778 family cysteine peptidase [Alteromonas salexigens]